VAIRFDDIGYRLKAFRRGSGLGADEIARRIGISRTALYRFEKGEVVKIETLEKLSELLDVSVPTLLGVGVEYVATAVSFFERVRQIEQTAEHIIVLAGPVSQLKRHSLASQTRLLINESFARARNGEYVRAYNAAERAFSTSVHAESEAQAALGERLTDLAELEEDKVTAGWLWGAMALKVGKASNLGKRLEQTSSPSLAELAKWLKIAAMNEDERRPLRRKLVLPVKRLPKAAMPAALFVTGSVVPGTTDVEVWLDRLFAMQHLTQPIRMMLARAEAARWRGDAAVVRLWEGRAAASRKSMIDYRSTLLADFVQLR
jgi:transcriptional regulator with XRE-family HTH domain